MTTNQMPPIPPTSASAAHPSPPASPASPTTPRTTTRRGTKAPAAAQASQHLPNMSLIPHASVADVAYMARYAAARVSAAVVMGEEHYYRAAARAAAECAECLPHMDRSPWWLLEDAMNAFAAATSRAR